MTVAADGTNQHLFSDAQPVIAHQLQDGMAPVGGWVAFTSGDNPMTPDPEGSGALTLNLLNVVDGTLKPITPLFAPEMEEAIKAANLTGDRNDAVEAGIAILDNSDTLKWSPDGRYLAFIAAIDGPSSDVYSYDRETGQDQSVDRRTESSRALVLVAGQPMDRSRRSRIVRHRRGLECQSGVGRRARWQHHAQVVRHGMERR